MYLDSTLPFQDSICVKELCARKLFCLTLFLFVLGSCTLQTGNPIVPE